VIQAASPDSWSGLGLAVRQVRPWLKKARVIPVETARPNPEVIQDKAPRFPGQNRCYSIFQFGLHDLQMSRSPADICATACRFLTANHSEYEDKKVLSVVAFLENGITILMVGIGMGMTM